MPKKLKITEKQIIEAVKGSHGYISQIAKRCGCSRDYIYTCLKKSEAIQKAIDDENETFKDWVESKLVEKINEGDTQVTIFVARTKLRDRGYSDKFELTGANNTRLVPNQIIVSNTETGDAYNAIVNGETWKES